MKARGRTGPTAGVQNGLACNRSTDVWGIALDGQGNLMIAWPTAPANTFGCSTCNGTFMTQQTDGPTIAPAVSANAPEVPWAPALLVVGSLGAAVMLRRRSVRSRRGTGAA